MTEPEARLWPDLWEVVEQTSETREDSYEGERRICLATSSPSEVVAVRGQEACTL